MLKDEPEPQLMINTVRNELRGLPVCDCAAPILIADDNDFNILSLRTVL
jgi:hypothetical protein